MRKNNRFALKTTAIVLLGFVFCLALAGRSDAQKNFNVFIEDEELGYDEREFFDVPDGKTSDFYSDKIQKLGGGVILGNALYHVDKPRLESDDREAFHAFVLRTIATIKTTIGKLLLTLGDSKAKNPDQSVRFGLRTIYRSLDILGAHGEPQTQEEFSAFEQDLRRWLDETDAEEIKDVFNEYLTILKTDREVAERIGTDGDVVESLLKLRDGEKAKDEPNAVVLNRLEQRIADEVPRKVAENVPEAEKILQEMIDRENAEEQPNEQHIAAWNMLLRKYADDRLVRTKDVEGASELWREALELSFEQPEINIGRVVSRLRLLEQIDPQRGSDAFDETIERYLASGVDELVKKGLEIGRYRTMEGTKIKLEGVCVDGTPLDWNDYVGKAGAILLLKTKEFEKKEFRDLYDILRQYANGEGVNIVGYVADDDLDLWKPFAEETPWKTVSRKLTLDAGDAKYRDITVYYAIDLEIRVANWKNDIHALPKLILFDEQGVVAKNTCLYGSGTQPFWIIKEYLSQMSPDVAKREIQLLTEICDVPDGKDGAFYLEKREKLLNDAVAAVRRLSAQIADVGTVDDWDIKRRSALKKLDAKLAKIANDDSSVEKTKKTELLEVYVNELVEKYDRVAVEELAEVERAQEKPDEKRLVYLRDRLRELPVRKGTAEEKKRIKILLQDLEEERAKENPDKGKIFTLTQDYFLEAVQIALRENDEHALKDTLDRCVEDAIALGEVDGRFPEWLVRTMLINLDEEQMGKNAVPEDLLIAFPKPVNHPLAAEYLRLNARRKLEKSDSPKAREYADELAAVDRRKEAPGNETVFQGSYFNPDDPDDVEPFDLKNYRGKPVLIFYFSPKDPRYYKGLDVVRDAYQKYHDAGLEIVGYFPSVDAPYEEVFIERENVPWETVCDRNVSDDPIRHAKFASYYALPLPSASLVGADGKVIGLDVSNERLRLELRKLFPNVQ